MSVKPPWRAVCVCWLFVALWTGRAGVAHADTATATTAGGDGGGFGVVFVLLVLPAVLLYLAVTYGFIRLADRHATSGTDE